MARHQQHMPKVLPAWGYSAHTPPSTWSASSASSSANDESLLPGISPPGKCVTTVVIYYSYTCYFGITDSDTDIQCFELANLLRGDCTETRPSPATPNLLNRQHPVSLRLRATDHWVNQQPRPGRIEPASLLGETCALTIRTTVGCIIKIDVGIGSVAIDPLRSII
ncbi:hypothetical protein LXL04_005375 [Taraxacum kok-saghyz]